jgi:uncharacterized protein YgbK (DUF1537 family)
MAPRPRFCVIADDLTGALDTAAPFASHGWRTRVVPWPGSTRGVRGLAAVTGRAWASSDVVVIDTASRHAAPREAARRVRAATATAAARRCACYKKIDSTLRGNVAAELAAFRRAAGVACLPVAPAFPAQGRTTRGGAVFVDGRPLAASAAAHDARDPVTSGVIARLAPAGALDVFDAATDADLRRLARRLARGGRLHGCVGAGGLATAIAATLGSRRRAVDPRGVASVLVVAGSAHPAARAQVAALVAGGALGLVVPIAARAATRDLEATVLLAAAALGAGRSVVLVPPPLAPGARVGTRPADAAARRLAAVVVRLVALAPVGAVLTVGGDTTAAVVAAAQWAPLDVAGALLPGVALVALPARPPRRGQAAGPRWLVTKSGAFGDADTLRRLVRRLTSAPRTRPSPGRSASPR